MRLAFALLLCAGVQTARAQPVIGDHAPSLSVSTLQDSGLNLTPRKGQVILVDFSATWCGPCHQALAVLRALVAASAVNGRVRLVIVDVNEPKAKVAAFYADTPNLEVTLDTDGQAARTWGALRFPTTFVLDDSGIIRHINRGFGPGYPDRLQAWVQGLLR